MPQYIALINWLILPDIILFSGLFGIIYETILLNKLKNFTRSEVTKNELFSTSLHKVPRFCFLFAGVYKAILIPIAPKLSEILQKIITALILYTIVLILARLTA